MYTSRASGYELIPVTAAPAEETPAQPMLSDFELHKCVQCEKMAVRMS
jgi:hypothetical protein